MEMIGKVSKGSKMDQIYIPKNRNGLAIGNYVIIKSLEEERPKKPMEKLFFYGIIGLEPIKSGIVNEILKIIDRFTNNYDNIIITGSFLEDGFHFNDIDVLIITKYKSNRKIIEGDIERKTGIKAHILFLNNKELLAGLETDPLYRIMLSKSISKKRFVYNTKSRINYKMLDLHLLKSKILIDNFDVLSGDEKYSLIRNVIAIYLYLENNKLSKELVDNKIKKVFNLRDIKELKQNLIDKKDFLKKYKLIYNKTFSKIIKGIENGSKQK